MRQRYRLIGCILGAALVVGLAVASAGFVHSQTADTAKVPIHDPDLDLPFAERDAKYQADWDGFVRYLEAWVASVDPEEVDYERLRHAERMVEEDPSESTLDEATAAVVRVVVVRVRSLRLTAMSGTTVTAHVERVLKGPMSQTIEIGQSGELFPGPDWIEMVISDDPGDPLLLPGHRYLLFLGDDPRWGLYVQPFSGWYELQDGTVHALERNAFRDEVDGLLERDFVRLVEASVRRRQGR